MWWRKRREWRLVSSWGNKNPMSWYLPSVAVNKLAVVVWAWLTAVVVQFPALSLKLRFLSQSKSKWRLMCLTELISLSKCRFKTLSWSRTELWEKRCKCKRLRLTCLHLSRLKTRFWCRCKRKWLYRLWSMLRKLNRSRLRNTTKCRRVILKSNKKWSLMSHSIAISTSMMITVPEHTHKGSKMPGETTFNSKNWELSSFIR